MRMRNLRAKLQIKFGGIICLLGRLSKKDVLRLQGLVIMMKGIDKIDVSEG